MHETPIPTSIDFLIFDQFSNHCLANCMEPFRAANTLSAQEVYRWNIVSLDGQPVQSSSGMQLLPDQSFQTPAPADYLFIISSYGFRGLNTLSTRRALHAAQSKYGAIVGLDTGPWLMAAAGVLDGHPCTVHWDILDEFAEAFPSLDVQRHAYIWDGAIGTCGGAMVAFDLSLDLIRRMNGAKLALDVGAIFNRSPTAKFGVTPMSKVPLVQRAIDLMQSNIEDTLTIPAIAKTLNTTAKQLHRAFVHDLSQSPDKTYRDLRLSFARHLLQTTTHSIQEVALRSGYQDQSAFSRAFKIRFDQTPNRYRAFINRI